MPKHIDKSSKFTLTNAAQTKHLKSRFFLADAKDKAELMKAAQFTYVDRYVGSEISARQSQDLADKLAHVEENSKALNLFVAPVALLNGGRGVYAANDFQYTGTTLPIGIYWGHVTHHSPKTPVYCFWTEKFDVDALEAGNWTRFANHKHNGGQIIVQRRTATINSKVVPYMVYSLTKSVRAGDQLLFDYGDYYKFDNVKKVFLNPSDNDLSPDEFYEQNKASYIGTQFFAIRQLLNSAHHFGPEIDTVIAPELFHALYVKRDLKAFLRNNPKYNIDLPLLAVNSENTKLSPIGSQSGITLLMLACYFGDVETVKTLLEHDANVEQQHASTGHNSLFYAIQSAATPDKKRSILEMLLNKDARLTTQDEKGYTTLHWCVIKNDIDSLRFLFTQPHTRKSLEALESISENEELCAITLAIKLGHVDIMLFQLEQYHKHHGKKFFADNDNWILNALGNALTHCPNIETILPLMMSKGLNQNAKGVEHIMPILKSRNIDVKTEVCNDKAYLLCKYPSGASAKFKIDSCTFKRNIDPRLKIRKTIQKSSITKNKVSLFTAKRKLRKNIDNSNLIKKRFCY